MTKHLFSRRPSAATRPGTPLVHVESIRGVFAGSRPMLAPMLGPVLGLAVCSSFCAVAVAETVGVEHRSRNFVPLAEFTSPSLPGEASAAASGPAPSFDMPAAASLPDAPSAVHRAGLPLGIVGEMLHLYRQAAPSNPPQVAPAVLERPGAIDLTLDQAVANGAKGNLAVRLSSAQESGVHGTIFTVGNALLPNLSAEAYSNAQEINLAAQGFKASTLSNIKINGKSAGTIQPIVKVDVTAAQLNLTQALFNVPAYFLFRAAEKALEASSWTTNDIKDTVVTGIGGLYLRALADASQVRDAQALLRQDQVVFDHARAARDAGTGINLDVLRAQTDLQTEQQRLIQAQNAVAKDEIALNRQMGNAAGQQLNLVDKVPFAELAEQPLEDQLATAYRERKDLHSLEAQLAVAEQTARAIKYERVPTLAAGGYYGLIGVTTGSYHGNFIVDFQLAVPVFLGGELRGQREVGAAQIVALRNQIAGRRAQIEGDIRSSRLDLESYRELVKVAQSNVVLAQQALDDASLRFTSGVDDNLPVVQAQAALVGAQAQVIQAEFQYNYAKLTLARRLGVVQTDYDKYLGR